MPLHGHYASRQLSQNKNRPEKRRTNVSTHINPQTTYAVTSTIIDVSGRSADTATFACTARNQTTQMISVLSASRQKGDLFGPNKNYSETPELPKNLAANNTIEDLWYLGDHVSYLNNQLITDTDTLHSSTREVVPTHRQQKYPYTDQLLALEAYRPTIPRPMPTLGMHITSPLIVDNWRQALRNHPDQCFVQYLLEGLTRGFHIGFNREQTCTSCIDNMQSAQENPQPVEDYLQAELAAGRIVGPFPPHLLEHAQISRFGVIPKRNQPGKWRLILDLSSPYEHSVNDGISKELCSMRYITIDDAIDKILGLGPGCLLAKLDVEHAYRNVPVHPDDRTLLAMRWKKGIYLDTVLPFGLRSAPKIFSAVADALEWVLLNQGVSPILHYLDDFLTMGQADSPQCQNNLERIKRICEFLGLPLKMEKLEGPTVVLIFLGIILDTLKLEIRLPDDKLEELKEALSEWKRKRSCTKRELLRLIGKLSHATKVVTAGRTFLRRMIDTAMSVKRLNHHISLTQEFHSDLAWWECFLPHWNHRSFMSLHKCQGDPQIVFSSDASGTWGCGAIWSNRWIQCEWQTTWSGKSIALKELLPIVIACAVWGTSWSHKRIQVLCDNAAVIEIINAKTSKCKEIMHLLRCLYFFLAYYDCTLRAVHIPGVLNVAADAISRNRIQVLHQTVPTAQQQPDQVPRALWDLLVLSQPDWTSVNWRTLLTSYVRQA